jgi:tetratricopeptide (TPR) repeat protein
MERLVGDIVHGLNKEVAGAHRRIEDLDIEKLVNDFLADEIRFALWLRSEALFAQPFLFVKECSALLLRLAQLWPHRLELFIQDSENRPLEEALAAYREALKEHARERVPLGWAMTQNNLGNALEKLEEREAGAKSLEEAAATYREALKEYTRNRVPLQWAMTQNNLGNALERLGEREAGTASFTGSRFVITLLIFKRKKCDI